MEIKQTWTCRKCKYRFVVTIEPGEPMGKITQPAGLGPGCPKCEGTRFDVEFGDIVPAEGSHYTGILGDICYVDGKSVSQAEYRWKVEEAALQRAEEIKGEKDN